MKVAILTTDNREHDKAYEKPEPYFGTAPEALLEGFAELPQIEVHVVSCVRRPVAAPARLASNIYYHAVVVPKIGWMQTLYGGCVRAVRRKLRAIQPDVVHGQGTERDCAISAVLSGFPNVVTIHGNMAELARLFHAPIGSFHWLAARLETFCLRRTAGVLCNSQYTEHLAKRRARKTWRVPNALRGIFLSPVASGPAAFPPRIVNVGVISPRKRQVELLEMARQLQQAGHQFTLEFIGGCDARTDYGRAFLDALTRGGDDRRIVYHGTKSASELTELFDHVDALMHFPMEEAFGLVVAEALARNLKLFAADVGGIPDIAAGCGGAELIPPNDWAALSRALVTWVTSRPPRPHEAAATMQARYAPAIVAQRHLEIYDEVLSTRS